jgi:hypothetical protein
MITVNYPAKLEIPILFIYYILAIITIYLAPNIIGFVFFIFLLFKFYQSKNNYFWFALIFALVDPPGGFFPGGDLNYGLPMIQFPAYISFQEFFIYVAFVKAFSTGRKHHFVYRRPMVYLTAYLVVLFVSSLLIGTSILTLLKTVKWLLPWTLLYSLPRLVHTREEWDKLFALLFPIIIMGLIFQLMQILLGYPVASLVGTNYSPVSGEVSRSLGQFDVSQYDLRVARPISSPYINLICYVGTMFYLSSSKSIFSQRYLSLILLCAFFSILLTATRGWIIAYTIVLIVYSVFIYKKPVFFLRMVLPLLLLGSVVYFSSVIQAQLIGVTNRVATLGLFLKGDMTAGGTVKRINEYTPALLNIFYKSPILGWGFSDVFWINKNGHAGQANLLMNVGIVGFLLFIYFWYKLVTIPYTIHTRLKKSNPYKNSLLVLILGFLIFFILHNSSGQQFQYLIGSYGSSFGQIYFYGLSDFFLRNALQVNKQI